MLDFQLFRHSLTQPWTYALLDAYQRSLAEKVHRGGRGEILLSEVAPVITLGKRADRATEVTFSEAKLEKLGIEIYPTDRGGFATYHGPGQWILFWVEKLERLTGDSRGVRKWVDILLQSALETVREFGVQATIHDQAHLGIWTKQGKVASCGIAVQQGVVLHGMSLNAFRHPLSFLGLRPCGLQADPGGNPLQMDYVLSDPSRFLELGLRWVENLQSRVYKLAPHHVDEIVHHP